MENEILKSNFGYVNSDSNISPISNTQFDIWNSYNSKAQYEVFKQYLHAAGAKEAAMNKLWLEESLETMRFQYKQYAKLVSSTVYRDQTGTLIYAITNPENQKIVARRLLAVENFRSIIYTTFWPDRKSVLVVSWGNADCLKSIVFNEFDAGISPNLFLRKLKQKGLLLLVSGRTEIKAAEALLAFVIQDATMEEIPARHGWGKTKNGDWHYAMKNEFTLEELCDE